jgi:hypothetical protein
MKRLLRTPVPGESFPVSSCLPAKHAKVAKREMAREPARTGLRELARMGWVQIRKDGRRWEGVNTRLPRTKLAPLFAREVHGNATGIGNDFRVKVQVRRRTRVRSRIVDPRSDAGTGMPGAGGELVVRRRGLLASGASEEHGCGSIE